jgi:hypothetical protein
VLHRVAEKRGGVEEGKLHRGHCYLTLTYLQRKKAQIVSLKCLQALFSSHLKLF